MSNATKVNLFGSLREYEGESGGSSSCLEFAAPAPLEAILSRFRIPLERVQLAMVNHRAVPRDQVIHPGDRVSLFPKEYAIFADWKDFRN